MARKSLTVTIYKSELIYDIQNKTYLSARSKANEKSPEAVAAMQVNGDDENVNQILRSIGSAFASLKPILGEYISGSDTTANNIMEASSGNLTLTLSMPENFNQAESASISNAVHDFIVNTATSEWYLVVSPAESAAYSAMAARSVEQLRAALAKRNRPSRTTPVV